MPVFRKPLIDYFSTAPRSDIANLGFRSPAKVFLQDAVEIADSVRACSRKFQRKQNGDFTKDSQDAFQNLAIASFALLMSHFEAFQKAQLGELIDSLDFVDLIDDSKGLLK